MLLFLSQDGGPEKSSEAVVDQPGFADGREDDVRQQVDLADGNPAGPRDALQVPYVELKVEAALPLECQRSLQRFLQPVRVVQRLGLIRDEADEAGLPEGYEPLLLAEDGMLRPSELVEDELILAVPVVAVMPGTEAMERDWPAREEEQHQASPFAALAGLKKDR